MFYIIGQHFKRDFIFIFLCKIFEKKSKKTLNVKRPGWLEFKNVLFGQLVEIFLLK